MLMLQILLVGKLQAYSDKVALIIYFSYKWLNFITFSWTLLMFDQSRWRQMTQQRWKDGIAKWKINDIWRKALAEYEKTSVLQLENKLTLSTDVML